MEDDLAQRIIKRFNTLYDNQSTWRSTWQDLANYIHPNKSNILSQKTPGTKLTQYLFDATLPHANELLAASMNGALTSASVRWFGLKVRNVVETREIREWLEDCANRMHIALRQSNFNSEIHECYLDLGAFGTSALEIMERSVEIPGFNGLHFKTYSIGEYVVDEDAEGMVDTVIRKFKLTSRAAIEKFGTAVVETIRDAVKERPTQEFEFLHAVFPTANEDDIKIRQLTKRFKYASVYVDLKAKTVIRVGGFREKPIPVARWSKTSGEPYGRGPGFTALPDGKTLNRIIELELKAAAKAIDPPVEVVDDGIIGNITLQPSGINYVRVAGNIKPIEFNAKFQITQLKIEDLRQSIRRIFFSDQLQFQETPQMTATEVYVRYELMQRLLGPTLGRLQSELLNPSVERIFAIMMRAGAFLPVPYALRKSEIDIEYEGPMARAQRSADAVAVMRTLETAGTIANVDPTVFDRFDFDKIIPYLAEANGMPTALLRDDKAVEMLRNERAKQQAAEGQKQDLRDLGEGAKNVAPLIKAVAPQAQAQQGEK